MIHETATTIWERAARERLSALEARNAGSLHIEAYAMWRTAVLDAREEHASALAQLRAERMRAR